MSIKGFHAASADARMWLLAAPAPGHWALVRELNKDGLALLVCDEVHATCKASAEPALELLQGDTPLFGAQLCMWLARLCSSPTAESMAPLLVFPFRCMRAARLARCVEPPLAWSADHRVRSGHAYR